MTRRKHTASRGRLERGGRVPAQPRARRPLGAQPAATAAVSGGRKRRSAKRAGPPASTGPADVPALADAELETILLAIVRGTGRLGKQELLRRAQRVADWATRVRIDAAALELVLRGKLDIIAPERLDEELAFVRRGATATARPSNASTTPRTSRRIGAA